MWKNTKIPKNVNVYKMKQVIKYFFYFGYSFKNINIEIDIKLSLS